MKPLFLILLWSLLGPHMAIGQTDTTVRQKTIESSTSKRIGMGALQVSAATVGFVGPMMILMPKFVDSDIYRYNSFLFFPLSVSIAGLLYGTNWVGELMGGEDNFGATFLGGIAGFFIGSRGWTSHSSRTTRYLHFSAPIIAGAVSFYWLANVLAPSASIQMYLRHDGGAGLGVSFRR